MRITLRTALLLGLVVALTVALVPAGMALDRLLGVRLETAAREDLGRAPMVLKDRNAARADALMMHAQEVAGTPGLADALQAGRDSAAARLVEGRAAEDEAPVVVAGDGRSVRGPRASPGHLEATRGGKAPVGFVQEDGRLYSISVAPVTGPSGWVGAAGVTAPVDEATAATLAALTASEVTILAGDTVVASTLEASRAGSLASSLPTSGGDTVRELDLSGDLYWVTEAPLGDVGRVLFAVDRARELALLPELRRAALLALGLALALALVLGALLATGVVRPVRGLARAADRLAAGDFEAPLDASWIEEVDRMAHAFTRMRGSLRARLEELSAANQELAERQARLQALQSELIRRDRLAASGRLVTELAHEIRNPVANIRNCLEVVHRRLEDDSEGRRFADLAIDELLRMHELAEQMLDLNRPMDPGASRADPTEVVEQVAALYRAGAGEAWSIEVEAERTPPVAIPPDTLKQVLLNLVQNAREAMEGGGAVRLGVAREGSRAVLTVEDEGPGVPDDLLDRIFDPFVTTKGEVSGVGLGLFIAHGLITRFDGRLDVEDGAAGGAVFRIELPLAVGSEPHAERSDDAADGTGTMDATSSGAADERGRRA